MRIRQYRPPADYGETNVTRLGNDTLGRKRKQRPRGPTETKGKVYDTAGKPNSPDLEHFLHARERPVAAFVL